MIQLFSGGLDSLIIWRLLDQPTGLYVKLGSRSMDREIETINKIEDRYGGVIVRRSCPMSSFEMDNGYVPYRNALLVLIAAQHDDLVCVSQIAEWAPDKNLRFWGKMTSLMRQAAAGSFQGMNRKPKVIAPFHKFTKADLLYV